MRRTCFVVAELHLPATPSTTTTTTPPRHSHEPGKHRNRNKSTNANNKTPAHSKDTQAKQQGRKKAQQLDDAASSSTEQHGGAAEGTVTATHWDQSTKSPPRRRDRWNDLPGSSAPGRGPGAALQALLALGLVGVLAGWR